LTVVVDHDFGRLVWTVVGRDGKTLNGFFDLLESERSTKITSISAPSGSVSRCRAGLERHALHRQLPHGPVGLTRSPRRTGTDLHAVFGAQGREARLQIGAGGFVALLGSQVERGRDQAISPTSLNGYEVAAVKNVPVFDIMTRGNG
jgi:hypothetical protein